MSDTELLLTVAVGFLVILICIIFYMLLKEKEATKKQTRLEEAIGGIITEIYRLQKSCKSIEEAQYKAEFNSSTMGSNIKDEISSTIGDGLHSMLEQVNLLQETLKADRDYLEERIITLESKMRDVGHFANSSPNIDERRIITMYQDGWSVDSIAKELHVGRGEVEFILKLADIK